MRELALFAAVSALVSTGSAQAMTYGLVPIGGSRCANRCPVAVVASGLIQANEAERMVALLQSAGQNSGTPRNLIVSSPGGDLAGALKLGLVLRRLGIRTVVGSVTPNPYGHGSGVLAPGTCGSACVFVLMAGTNRQVVPGSRVAVHAPQVTLVGQDRSFVLGGALARNVIQGVEPLMRTYAREMGVDPALIAVADRVPNETRLTLSSAELSRYHLVTGGTAARRPVRQSALRSPGLSKTTIARAAARPTR